jgi:hypothetical protein
MSMVSMIAVMDSFNLIVTATPNIHLKNRGEIAVNIWRKHTDIAAALTHTIV